MRGDLAGYVVSAVVAGLVVLYLVAALLFPERF